MFNILIIEDELPAANRLTKMLADVAPDARVVMTCDSIETSVQYLKSNQHPDLIFLDIQLGDGLSFNIFSQIEVLCPVIFTTAYDDYVFRAFELNSIDYLLKPINKEELTKSIDKFNRLHQVAKPDLSFLTSLLQPEKTNYKQRFLVNAGTNIVSVKTSDVAYFYSVEKATFLVTYTGKSYAIDFSLDKLETIISDKDFFRINRQYLVSVNAIKKINVLSKSRMKLHLEPTTTEDVYVSNARTHEFRLWLDK